MTTVSESNFDVPCKCSQSSVGLAKYIEIIRGDFIGLTNANKITKMICSAPIELQKVILESVNQNFAPPPTGENFLTSTQSSISVHV